MKMPSVLRHTSIATAAALALALTSPTRADTWPRQDGIDAQNYIFHLTFSDTLDQLSAESTAEILFTKDGISDFFLDLATPTPTTPANKGMTVTELTSAGKPLKYTHEDNKLHISLPEPSKAGQKTAFTIKYHGIPAAGVHIGNNKYGDRVLFSENWPNRAHEWLPCIDHPHDKATAEMFITAPAQFRVISNGLLLEDIDQPNGMHLSHWKQSVPIATWLNAVGIAKFSIHKADPVRNIPLQTWVYPQEAEALNAPIEDAARKSVEFYSDYVGPFAYEKLANVQAFGISGGTEHATAIFYGDNSLNPTRSFGLVAHEVAHHWFGDCVTEKDWNDIWLSEGFATYFTLLCTEKYQGRDAFITGVKRSQMTVLRANPQLPVIHDNVADGRRILNNFVYQKGSCTLHMLRGLIGDEKFQAGIRDYYKTYYNTNASTDDLRAKMEAASGGGMKLDWFFDQWLKRPGIPTLNGTWHYDPATKKVIIDLAQTQTADPYRLPLEIAITTAPPPAAPTLQKFELTQRTQSFQFPADTAPTTVTLDPNAWTLMLATFNKQ